MSWKDLDIKQKAELIKLGVQSGIRDIKQIRQLYDDINTPTQVVDQSYNETNVKPLQGIERIKQEYGIPEEEVNKANDIIQQIENEISLEEINNQQPVQFRQFKNGGPIEDKRIKKYNNNSAGYLYDSFVTDSLEEGENPHNSRRYTIPEEQAEKLGYYRDEISGHRDDAVKLQDHPSHNSRGTFKDIDGYHIFDLTDKGANDVNYTISGLIDNGDGHVIPIYNGSYILPEITVTPDGNYVHDTYNNLKWHSNNPTQSYSGGGPIKRKRENSLDWRMAVYNAVDPRSTVKNIDDAFRLYNAAVAKEKRGEDFKDYTLNNTIGDLTSDAAWRKRLQLPYDETLLPVWNGDTVSLSRPLELEIPIDTNLVKDRINYAQNEFWNDVKSLNLRQLKEDLSYKKSQEELLDALRYTYKTGKPIGVSEYHANSIDPEKVLKDFKYGISPLNVLGRYNIRYDKDENKMYYSDEWDFNQYEWAVPGTTFRIRGAIPLNNKNEGKIKKYSKGGYEGSDENTIYTAGYSEPITVTAKKELSKRQQMQADEEWREYLKQHPIQIGSEEYNRLPERAKAQVHKNNWISKRTIKENPLLQYSTNYFKNKTGQYTPFYIDLSDKKVQYIDKNTNNVESILGNEFYELRNPNTVRYKKDFINTQDTLLGDRNIPLSKINTFYGIEDGKLKVGDIDVFKDNTIIIPNRSKNYGKLSKIIVKEPYKIPKLTHKERKKAMEKSRRYVEFVKNNIQQKYGIELSTRDIKDPLSIKDKEIQQHVINIRNDFYTGYTENPRDRYSSLYGVTVNNDTIPIKINATPKVFFGNEQGNSIFVSNLVDQDILYKVNEFLKHNPSIPIMIDNGRFSHFTLNPTEISQYSGVTPSEKLTMIGTVYKNGGFLFPNQAFSHKFEK